MGISFGAASDLRNGGAVKPRVYAKDALDYLKRRVMVLKDAHTIKTHLGQKQPKERETRNDTICICKEPTIHNRFVYGVQYREDSVLRALSGGSRRTHEHR